MKTNDVLWESYGHKKFSLLRKWCAPAFIRDEQCKQHCSLDITVELEADDVSADLSLFRFSILDRASEGSIVCTVLM